MFLFAAFGIFCTFCLGPVFNVQFLFGMPLTRFPDMPKQTFEFDVEFSKVIPTFCDVGRTFEALGFVGPAGLDVALLKRAPTPQNG